MSVKRSPGRPKKEEHEKVEYQRIAVYSQDYQKLGYEIAKRNSASESDRIKITDAFSEMVKSYCKK